MNLDEFWQENKRWLLGCAAGLLVFLIARSILGNVYGGTPARAGSRVKATPGEKYKSDERTAVLKEKAELDARLAGLRAAMHYVVPQRFVREGDPHLFWAKTYSAVRGELFGLAYDLNIEFPESALSWKPGTDPADLERALVGLSLVQHVVEQLTAAHRAVLKRDVEALGCRAIHAFVPERASRARIRRHKPDEPIRPEELLSEVKVGFKFEADHATVHRFLENLRDSKLRVGFGSIKIVHGRTTGDPLTVTGDVTALTIKPIPTDS